MRGKCELGMTVKKGNERIPLVVQKDTAQVQDPFGALAPPTHAGAVQAQPDQVADGAFGDACANGPIVSAEALVGDCLV